MYATQIACHALSNRAVANTLITVIARAARTDVASRRAIAPKRKVVRQEMAPAIASNPSPKAMLREEIAVWVYEGGSGDEVT